MNVPSPSSKVKAYMRQLQAFREGRRQDPPVADAQVRRFLTAAAAKGGRARTPAKRKGSAAMKALVQRRRDRRPRAVPPPGNPQYKRLHTHKETPP